MDYKKRNTRIVEFYKNGKSRKEMSEVFNLSLTRVCQIINRDKQSCLKNKRILDLTKKIKSVNSLDKRWRREEILDCLLLSKRAYTAITHYYEIREMFEISLNELMDFYINKNVKKYMDVAEGVPILNQTHIGGKKFIGMFPCVYMQG